MVNFFSELGYICILTLTFAKRLKYTAIIKWLNISAIEFDWKSFLKSFDLKNDRPMGDRDQLTSRRSHQSLKYVCAPPCILVKEHPVSLSNVIRLKLLSLMKVSSRRNFDLEMV